MILVMSSPLAAAALFALSMRWSRAGRLVVKGASGNARPSLATPAAPLKFIVVSHRAARKGARGDGLREMGRRVRMHYGEKPPFPGVPRMARTVLIVDDE